MTRQSTFKHRVRSRMAKTGESYTAARRMLISAGNRPEAPGFKPPMSDGAVAKATGRPWQDWFQLLDGWGATTQAHPEIARWLVEEHEVDGWWAQSITVAYEQARGLRAPGQRPDGWSVSASKTFEVPVARLFEAFEDEAVRREWLPDADLRLRTATPPRSARYDWADGSTRVNVGFTKVAEDKSRVAIQHERLPNADSAEHMKAYWRGRLGELKQRLTASEET
jgi:uncharacterized protein YndB with AHSA1/START domain